MKESTSYHQGTMRGWSVEGRLQGNQPGQIGAQLLDNRWSRIQFDKVPPPYGVPNGGAFDGGILDTCGLYIYETAQALRWWLHANAHRSLHTFSLETRLVAHKVQHKVEWDRDGEHDYHGTWPEEKPKPQAPSVPPVSETSSHG